MIKTVDGMIAQFERLEEGGADPRAMHKVASEIADYMRSLATKTIEFFNNGDDTDLKTEAEVTACEFEYAADLWQGIADGLKEFID